MAVRSRSSLHVRQDPDLNMLPPPSKRPRLEQQHYNPPALPSRHRHTRRGSSPDLLDTTIEPSSSSKPSSVRPANSPLSTTPLPPRASSRLLSSAHHARPSTPSNTLRTPGLQSRHITPSTTPVADPRESPDPLDTISPAPAISSQRIRPSPAVRETRQQHHNQHHQQQHKIENIPGKPAESEKATRPNASRSSRRSSIPPPESQPAPGPSAGGSPIVRERRSLRSHDSGTKPRSELASYFPNYEQLLSLEPQKTGMLCANCAAPTIRIELTVVELWTGDTTIQLVDDLAKPPSTYLPHDLELPFGNPLAQFHGCEVIQLPEPERDRDDDAEDPLDEGFYFRSHRRVERQEKQLRNIERERAQHEKLQVDRLLDELRGQDWLRVMGIAGVSDNVKKLYEPKRNLFVRELTALINKFKVWKEEEKRRKLAKDKPPTSSPGAADGKELDEDEINDADVQSAGEAADPNDVDTQAANQLLREARSATSGKRAKQTHPEKRRKPKPKTTPTASQEQPQPSVPPPPPLDPLPYIENKPFTSFFADPHLRAAALSSTTGDNRETGPHRSTLAFGHPIPDMQERDFQLPDEILTEEAILASQRKQRRMKREGRRG